MYAHNISVRYKDIDALRHVSHVEYVTYMQQARLQYLKDELDIDAYGIDPIVVHLEIDYEQPIYQEDDVIAYVQCRDPGETSFRTDYEIRANDELAATGKSVQVVADAATGNPRPLPEEWEEKMD